MGFVFRYLIISLNSKKKMLDLESSREFAFSSPFTSQLRKLHLTQFIKFKKNYEWKKPGLQTGFQTLIPVFSSFKYAKM